MQDSKLQNLLVHAVASDEVTGEWRKLHNEELQDLADLIKG
jgi:hypothetical protein